MPELICIAWASGLAAVGIVVVAFFRGSRMGLDAEDCERMKDAARRAEGGRL